MNSFGDDIAQALSRKLGWVLITRDNLFSHFPDVAATPYDLQMLKESAKYYLNPRNGRGALRDVLKDKLQEYSSDHSAVVMGFGSQIIFADRRDALHVRVIASKKVRAARAKKQYRVSDEEAEKILGMADKKHKKFVSTVFEADLSDAAYYHLILNTDTLTVDECVAAILALYHERELIRQMEMQSDHTEIKDHLSERPVFKNESEAEFARILDMYQMEWKYEPKTFPIEWDAEGNITMAFSPDFYLTKFDTYIELTTMYRGMSDQKQYGKKRFANCIRNNIKIVYKNDFMLCWNVSYVKENRKWTYKTISGLPLRKKIEKRSANSQADHGGLYRKRACPDRVLKVLFLCGDLSREIDLPVRIDFISIGNYPNSTARTGVVRITKDLDRDISGKHVLVIEDIIRSGLTTGYLMQNLESRGAASIKICTLLFNPEECLVQIPIAYTGFLVSKARILGYGLDINEKGRNLPYIVEV
jgi:hypoxanthine phosphoribosyltransferase